MKKLYFGWADSDITPSKRVALSGQFEERISEYVEKPLLATALSISDGDEHTVFVSCDLVGTSANLIDAVRKRFEGNSVGIDPMKIVLNAIHTHTGPEYPRTQRSKMPFLSNTPKKIIKSFLPDGKEYIEKAKVTENDDIISPEETFDFLVDKLCGVITESWNNLDAGAYSNAFGRAAVGMCRRAVYSDGSAQMWGNTDTSVFVELEGGNDSGIELMYIFDRSSTLTGIIVNIACPAQCVQHRRFISPDFWGEVRMLLDRYFGRKIYVLAQCSAAGDQCPVDLIRWVEPESPLNDPNIDRDSPLKRRADPSMFDISGMKKAGKRIANEIIDVYENDLADAVSEAVFNHDVTIMKLPLRRVTLEDVTNARRAIKDYLADKEGNVDYVDAAKLQVHMGILKRMEVQEIQNTLDTEVHTVRLGNIVFATNPFELFLDYGNRIKARSRGEQTFLVQLANGSEGYLPTEKAERGGHYSAFVSSGQVGHEGGELLVRETLDKINNELFS